MIEKNKYTWDLSLVMNENEVEINKEEIKNIIDKIYENKEEFFKTEKGFKKYMDLQEKYITLLNRMFCYLHVKKTDDFSNTSASQAIANFQDWYDNYSSKIIDIKKYIIKYEKNIKEFTKLKGYEGSIHFFRSDLRTKKYMLDSKSEQIINKLSSNINRFENIFSTFNMSEYKIRYLWKNKIVTIDTDQAYEILKDIKNRDLREVVYKANKEALQNYKNTIFSIALSYFKAVNEVAKIKKYESYIDQVCVEDDINQDIIPTIFKYSKSLKPLAIRINKLKKKYLKKKYNIKNIKPWDLGLSTSDKSKNKYSIEYAQEIILENALNISKNYHAVIQKAFQERWIDYTDKDNKYTGAYCYSIAGSNKSLLSLRYKHDLNSISCLNHELGHAVNFYYLYENNKWFNNSSNHLLIEIPSTAAETVFSNYIIEKQEIEDRQKIDLLFNSINTLLGPVHASYISETEYYINKKIEKNETVELNELKDHTYNLVNQYYRNKYSSEKKEKKYYDEFDEHIDNLRTPHYYYGVFYYYKYALSSVCATIMAKRIKNKDKDAIKQYEDLLKIGNQLTSNETLDKIGIDLYKESTWKEVYDYIEKEIIKLEKLVNKVK